MGIAINPLLSPNLGGFLKEIGDTPKTLAGEKSPAPLQRPLRLCRFPLFTKEGVRGSSHPSLLDLSG